MNEALSNVFTVIVMVVVVAH
ncbi:MAG: hypothetical protein JNJ99_07530 [Crocinitomicaceae bacterium]|nr:hypothetical protein [Crocinitomicaceae bacterium]